MPFIIKMLSQIFTPGVQEVVPVKTEPAVAAITSYAGGSQEAEEQQLASYEDENYAEYGQYEEQGYEDAGMVDFNQSMDGNKGNTYYVC